MVNISSPEYIAQWAGVCVEMVINATYCCLVAFLALCDEVVMMPPEEEKECAKQYVEEVTCPEWRNRFLLVDGTKFVLFQKPKLHGEAWFNKNKNYSIDCQVRSNPLRHKVILTCTLSSFRSSVCHKVYWSLTTHWVTQAACTMHGHSEALKHSRTMRKYSGKVNECGQTLYIHLRHGALPHLRSLSTDSSLQTSGHIIIGYLRWVMCRVQSSMNFTIYRFVYKLSTP